MITVALHTAPTYTDFRAAVAAAEKAALHSSFDQHVLELSEGVFTLCDEGASGRLPQAIVDLIYYTADRDRTDN